MRWNINEKFLKKSLKIKVINMANLSGNSQEQSHPSSFTAAANHSNGNSVMVAERWSTILKHNPGISLEWTAEEQAILEDGLQNFPSDKTITRYAKIAVSLQSKTVRDVALRCRWMTKKENSKRRKEELSRINKDKKERIIDGSVRAARFTVQANVLPYASTIIPREYDDCISYRVIGGPMGEILEKNAHTFNQISANLAALQTQNNIILLSQSRDNLLRILNDMNNTRDIIDQMPPLAVKVNEDLANTFLPPPDIKCIHDESALIF